MKHLARENTGSAELKKSLTKVQFFLMIIDSFENSLYISKWEESSGSKQQGEKFMEPTPTAKSIKEILRSVRHPEIRDNVVDLGMIHTVDVRDREVTIHVALPLDEISKEVRHKLAESVVDACKNRYPNAECLVHFEKMTQEEHDRFCEMASRDWAE